MNDELAIELFVKDGGMAHEWHAVDQVVRNHYEKLAAAPDSNRTQQTGFGNQRYTHVRSADISDGPVR